MMAKVMIRSSMKLTLFDEKKYFFFISTTNHQTLREV